MVGLLGRGGMGEVYRADDLELSQSVALKFLPEKVARNAADLARLRQEVRIARQIAHPNVCRTYDIAEAGGQVFVVMEYVDGEDLASVLRRLGRPTPDKALEIARQLCLGLGAAHENGVLHRDLKPANIMIDGRGRVRITDFGLAGTVEELAAEGGGAGTPGYMAPELLRGGAASAQSDIFALGLVLYELFTGKRASDVTPRPDSSRPDGDSSPRTPSSLVAGVDPAVERVILRCLERDPARRPQSAYAVFGALPGGDPLAAAVAAGETPSPELVANAGVEGSVRPLHAGLAVLVAVLSLLGISAIQTPLFKGFGKPPGVLSVRADEILTRLTGRAAPKYSAAGMRYAPEEKAHSEPAKQYWRRWSPSAFRMEQFWTPSPSLIDPPQAYPGSGIILLDTEARLLALEILPPSKPDSSASRGADWASLVGVAGRDPARAVSVRPPAAFAAYADTVAAWRLSDSTGPETTLVAAAVRGHVVRVETFAGRNALGRLAVVSNDAAPGIQDWFQVLLFWVLPLIGSIILARRNLRAKRGDIRGALVVGISIVILYLLYHLIPMSPEVGPFAILVEATGSASLGHALIRGVTMLLAYLAIEPYIRRLWPSVLVSWARLVAGRLRDPIIGRDVLVGAAAGAALPFVFTGAHSMEQALGFQVDPARLSTELLGTVISAPSVLAIVSLALALGVFRATTFYTILLILRFVLRNNRLAAIAALALFVLALSDYSSKSLWLDILVSLFAWGGVVWVAVRFGYVALTFIILVSLLVDVLPWTLDFSSWVAPQTMFAWGIMAVLLGYGFLTAVGGKSLFSDPLSDPVATGVRARK
ncbi:MAG TPA: serine/threonine-protein kinase [Candidatus Binatia bacterium]|nr:serine/threonine-protein kinase [Candidatus Binatia bacterium]